MFDKTRRFLRETRVELTKVTWPTRYEVITQTFIVIAMSAILAVVIGVFDFGLNHLVDWILSFR